MRESFHGYQEFLNNLKYFNLEDFALPYNSIVWFCNLWNTYHQNAQSHESTKNYAYKVISEGLEVSNSEYHSVFIIPKMVTLTCVYSYGKHVCNL